MLYDVAKVLLRVDDTVQILKAGAALKIGAATVTATPLVNGDATLGKTVCTAVKMNNGSDETISFNIFDWTLQSPSGTILNSSFAGSSSMLSSGEIAPGEQRLPCRASR